MIYRSELDRARFASLFIFALLLVAPGAGGGALAQTAQTAQTGRTPSVTVREFYKGLFEKRFREALGISIYKPAIEGLTQQEFDELRPDFEAMALGADKIEITGEQISGEKATVFVRVPDDNGDMQTSKVDLIRSGGAWIVGSAEDERSVKSAGKEFFYQVRIEAHHEEVKVMMERIIKAQLVYSSQHNGLYADIPTLVKEGLLPKDIETTASTGYRFHLTLGGDKKTYGVGAEPAQYGRTGKLSYFLDHAGNLHRKDMGGKPLTPEKK